MAKVNESPASPLPSDRSPNQVRDSTPLALSKTANKLRDDNGSPVENGVSVPSGTTSTSEEFISSVAATVAAQPVPCSDLNVWGVLTAISDKARKRRQGINLLLIAEEHCIGRLVEDADFRILSPAVSARHCKITRKRIASKDTEHQSDNYFSVYLKDTSTNGTYLNWEKLSKSGSEVKLCHGDIISIAFAPQHELAFAFVFREVKVSSTLSPCGLLKRKSDEYPAESKRFKGIGIGASDGPVSLDDFRSLQRSNTDLRKHLEDNVAIIESLRNDNRIFSEKHEIEMRELQESASKPYMDKLSKLNHTMESKDKELAELKRMSTEQKHEIDSLNQRLNASSQSFFEANEIIDRQKTSISQLEALLDEERDQRRKEREKASMDMKMALQKVQAEADENVKRVSDCALKREQEQLDVICKLQEADKERCILVETLRSKLEDARQNLVISDNKVRHLESQISQELEASTINIKKIEDLEHERTRMKKELENEKAAREEAWAKVSSLELEINASMRDLDYERRKLKAARERIMLRETQLRSFYSTTEEIQVLFVKQQEQLKAMRRTLEDEENYEGTSLDATLNPDDENENLSTANKVHFHGASRIENMDSSSDETIATEERSHEAKFLDNIDETQEVEFTTVNVNSTGAFGSEIKCIDDNGLETELMLETEGVSTAKILETEHVSETESQGRNIESTLLEYKMDVDNHVTTNTPESPKNIGNTGVHNPVRDIDGTESIRTADLLASEVAGSRECSTANHVSDPMIPCRDSVDESEHDVRAYARRNQQQRRALSEMIAPDLMGEFRQAVESDEEEEEEVDSSSSDTEDYDDYKQSK